MEIQEQVSETEIIAKTRDFITENFFFGADSIEYQNGDSLMAKGIVDSTGILELVTHIESTYSISVDDDELVPENLDTLANIAAYVLRKKQ
jgi:acyl carrier protein